MNVCDKVFLGEMVTTGSKYRDHVFAPGRQDKFHWELFNPVFQERRHVCSAISLPLFLTVIKPFQFQLLLVDSKPWYSYKKVGIRADSTPPTGALPVKGIDLTAEEGRIL